MTDTPIPDDVMKRARETMRAVLRARQKRESASDVIARAILAEREAQAKSVEELEEALRHIRSATYYPVSTEIKPRGWDWHMGSDAQEFVVETIESALRPRAIAKEGSDAV